MVVIHRLKVAAFVFSLAACSFEISAAPWEGPRLSEDELREVETPKENRGRNDALPKDYVDLVKENYHLMYVELFAKKQAEIQAASEPTQPDSRGGLNVIQQVALVDTAINPLGTSRNHALIAAGIALDVVNWLVADNPVEKRRQRLRADYANLNYPALWLVHRRSLKFDGVSSVSSVRDSSVRESFAREQSFLLTLPLACDIAYYRSTNPFGTRVVRGDYLPTIAHIRYFICGHDDLDISAWQAATEQVELHVQAAQPDISMSRFFMVRLDRNTGIQNVLGIGEDKIQRTAELLYQRIKPNLGDEWYAVYTAPNQAGEQKVFVANGEVIEEFPLPPDPDARQKSK